VGDPDVEFSSRLTKVSKILLKPQTSKLAVYLHSPSTNFNRRWIAVVDAVTEQVGKLKGSGVAASKDVAFLKAIVELGENFIFKFEGLADRNGIAGGLFRDAAKQRAVNELVERDAFLYHYRGKIPFIAIERIASKDHGSILLFTMASPVPQIKCYLATDEKCAKGDFPCILLGLGAHGDPLVARAKALDEYSTMYYDHLYRPGWCEFLECSPSKIGRITDFHHVQSRDPRNREIFKQLCTVGKDHQLSSARSIDVSKAWTYRHLESPVRFIRYVQASNPKITALSFGVPEPGSSNNQERPLFHPIW
jgi:hypothetical protein